MVIASQKGKEMEKLLLDINDTTSILAGIAFFFLLLVIFFRILKEVPFFESKAAAAIAATCVSMLSVMGMFHFLGVGVGSHSISEKAGGEGKNLDFILLPYAALGIAIVLLSLYLYGTKLSRNGKPKDFFGHAEDRTESVFQPDPCKGDKPAEWKVGKAHRGRMMINDNCPSPQPTNRLMGKHVHNSDARKQIKSDRMKQ
jgi:hypothetical protein